MKTDSGSTRIPISISSPAADAYSYSDEVSSRESSGRSWSITIAAIADTKEAKMAAVPIQPAIFARPHAPPEGDHDAPRERERDHEPAVSWSRSPAKPA